METIEEKHDIECEEIPTAQFGGINQDWYSKEAETTAEEIWQEELSNNQAIKRNDPNSRVPSNKFKANSGNYQIKGMIAVVDPEHGVIHGSTHSNAVNLLKEIVEGGPSVIERLAATGKQGKSVHELIKENYRNQTEDRRGGQTFSEYSVGQSSVDFDNHKTRRFAENMVKRRIDVVVKEGDKAELVEVKGEFKSDKVEKALGQLLLYKHLYETEHPEEEVELTAIFPEPELGQLGTVPLAGASEAIEPLVSIFEKHDVSVLFMTDQELFREPASTSA
jgi:hypothetical protein